MTPFLISLSKIIVLCSLVHLIAGHGFVHSVVANGQIYPGWNPFVDPYAITPPRIVRKVLNDGYVSGNDSDLACHHGGDVGTTALANAPSGSQVTFQWEYWPADHQGPVSTYMTSCNGDCSLFSANTARWFKIDADGYDPSNKQWAAAKLIANNFSWVSTIPAGLAPGQYLMRNEMYFTCGGLIDLLIKALSFSIALHSSEPQFYPSCSQLEITGSGTNTPSDSQLVTVQALYASVTFPNIYADSVSFTVPGPPPVTFNGQVGSPATTTPNISSTVAGSLPQTSVPGFSSPGPDNRQCHLGSRKLQRRNSLLRGT
uniref:lytic cellulose monooxygenase (C4-dehydrogenating) n=1 Tax=Psilocybe cubensis TaxID=181762 RepID=A0A8H7Y7J9_PSICU